VTSPRLGSGRVWRRASDSAAVGRPRRCVSRPNGTALGWAWASRPLGRGGAEKTALLLKPLLLVQALVLV